MNYIDADKKYQRPKVKLMMKMKKHRRLQNIQDLECWPQQYWLTVPHWQEIYDYVAPVYYKNCKTVTIKHGTVEEGFKSASLSIQ